MKKKIIKPTNGLLAKLVISTELNSICRTKYDLNSHLGAFTMKVDNKLIGYGKVLRYKKK